MKRKIIPRFNDEPWELVGVRLPMSVVDYVQQEADRGAATKSQVVRSIVVQALRDQGVIANAGPAEAAA